MKFLEQNLILNCSFHIILFPASWECRAMINDEEKPTPSLSLTDPNGVKAALFWMQRRSRIRECKIIIVSSPTVFFSSPVGRQKQWRDGSDVSRRGRVGEKWAKSSLSLIESIDMQIGSVRCVCVFILNKPVRNFTFLTPRTPGCF